MVKNESKVKKAKGIFKKSVVTLKIKDQKPQGVFEDKNRFFKAMEDL